MANLAHPLATALTSLFHYVSDSRASFKALRLLGLYIMYLNPRSPNIGMHHDNFY